jgi:hypothetical protein
VGAPFLGATSSKYWSSALQQSSARIDHPRYDVSARCNTAPNKSFVFFGNLKTIGFHILDA